MAKQNINVGTAELAGDGESIRSAFSKINSNFNELYANNTGTGRTADLGKFFIVDDPSLAILSTTGTGYGIVIAPNPGEGAQYISIPDNENAALGEALRIGTSTSTSAVQIESYGSVWTFDSTGTLTLPYGQSIGGGTGDGIKLTTDRGTVLFGNTPEQCVPTQSSHFHIMRNDPTTVDLFFGDDYNYVKLPYDSTLTNVGVQIGTDATNLWSFGANGKLTVPDDIQDVNGSVIRVASTSTAPTRVDGQLWFDNQEGRLYIKNGGVWLDASPTQIPSPETYLDDIEIDGSTLYINSSTLTINNSGTLLVNGQQVTGGGGQTNQITSGSYSISIVDTGVVTMATSRGNIEFGALPEPGGVSHFHIMKASASTAVDLYFGDDYNYVLQRGNSASEPAGHSNDYGVEIGTRDLSTETSTQHVWRFGTDGVLTLSTASTILGTGTDPNVYIETATTSTTSTWTFGTNGILTLPAATPVIKGGGTGTDVTIIASNTATTSTWVFGANGTLTLPTFAGSPSIVTIESFSNISLGSNLYYWNFGTDGSFTAPGPIYGGSNTIGLATPAPLNLNNTGPIGQVKTQLNLINTAGNAGTGSAVDYFTYVDQGNGLPGARLQAVDDNAYSANFSIALKGKGNTGNNGLTTVWTFGSDGDLTLAGGNVFFSTATDSTVMYNNGITVSSGTQYGTNVQGNTAGINQYWFADGTMPTRKWAAVRVNSPEDASTGSVVLSTGAFNSRNNWIFAHDGSTVLPENTLKGYCFTATNAVGNYIPQAGAFYYTDNPILRSIATIGGAWYIKGPGLVGWKQITGVQDNGDNLIIRIGNGLGPMPDGSEFHSGNYLPNSPDLVYTISQYLELDVKAADKTWKFKEDGSVTFPNNTVQTTAYKSTSGSWTLATGSNTVSITVPLNGNYQMWVNGNIPNGIVEWNATVNVSNPNVPAIGTQYAWYYATGNALVLTAIPNQIVGTAGVISSSTSYVGTTSNVFSFGIRNNSTSTQTVNWGYTTL